MNLSLILFLFDCLRIIGANAQKHRHFQPYGRRTILNLNLPPSGWEEWSNWSSCSRSCGGGARVQTRHCRYRQSYNNETRICAGSNKAYEPCNHHPCPDGTINNRRTECAKYNDRPFAGSTYLWEPLSAINPCILKCRARGSRLFVRHALSHLDGNECLHVSSHRKSQQRGEKPKHICISGQCSVVGCDGKIGSGLDIDKCGICGGDGESCEVVEGLFRMQNINNDFHLIARIPPGATKINITELSNTRSYLALRSASPDGSFYINGEITRGAPDRSNSYRVAGTIFRYDRPYMTEKGETLLADGPTSEELAVLLYYQGINPGIFFQYTLVRSTLPPPVFTRHDAGSSRERHHHTLLDQQPSADHLPSRRVGYGLNGETGYGMDHGSIPSNDYLNRFYHPPTRFRHTQHNSGYIHPPGFPVRQNNVQTPVNDQSQLPVSNAHYPTYWSNSNLDKASNPSEQNPYLHDSDSDSSNTRREALLVDRQGPEIIGETRWRTRGFGPCSQSCAGGIKRTIILCVKVATDEKVNSRFCTGRLPRMKVKRCNRQACPAYYHTEAWSDCSKTCGIGRRTRTIRCQQQFAGNFTTAVSHKKCRSLSRPNTDEACKTQDCARWAVSEEWTMCNAKCGSGTQRRNAICRAEDGTALPEESCSSSRKPDIVRPCDAGPCVTRWYVTDWEECTADCDRGVQRRHVFCLNTRDSLAGCSSKFEPDSTRTCARSSCGMKYVWFSGMWGTCSSKCGTGIQERKVTCMSIDSNGIMSIATPDDSILPCNPNEKPATQQPCNTQSCGSRWYYTPWSSCSVSCGGGSRTRDVQCLDASGAISSLCDLEIQPRDAERCNTVSCVAMEVSDPGCEDRLDRCRMILQARLCDYPYYFNSCCSTCTRAGIIPQKSRP